VPKKINAMGIRVGILEKENIDIQFKELKMSPKRVLNFWITLTHLSFAKFACTNE
jgi:hypothetical protein